jgi:sterol desaturase/sphingolipid hydroxylase (fatty acid hydroxylase superfamily)
MLHSAWWGAILIGLIPTLALVSLGHIVEVIGPAVPNQPRNFGLNILVIIINRVILAAAMPVTWCLLAPTVDALGGGLLHLPTQGLWLLPSVLIYVVVADFGESAFHLAQHRIPWMWAMHSLHHSDPAVNMTTAGRHYWFEFCLKALVIYAPMAIIFRTGPEIIGWFLIIRLLDFVAHTNVRVGFGPVAAWINCPQYHRIHHSLDPKHWDKNFAAYFTVFDRIMGTQYLPEPGEYPETGLDTGERPRNLADIVLWPARHSLRRMGFSVVGRAAPRG